MSRDADGEEIVSTNSMHRECREKKKKKKKTRRNGKKIPAARDQLMPGERIKRKAMTAAAAGASHA